MNLSSFIPGLSWIKVGGALLVVGALFYTGKKLVLEPLEARGYNKGVADQKAETSKIQKQLDDKVTELAKLKKDNEDALSNLASASQSQVKQLHAEISRLMKKTSAPIDKYTKQREEAIRDIISRNGNVTVIQPGQPYFAPIESAGLSKLGVDTVNSIIQANE